MAQGLTSAAPGNSHERWGITVAGVVQGVGFRPFVWSVANGLGLAGHVGNDDSGVFIEVQGPRPALEEFLAALRAQAPPLARVDSVTAAARPLRDGHGFAIVASRQTNAAAVALIPPDTASCPQCLAEVDDPADRRYRYPFTTCTYCGPRYTIVTGLPYDRPNTTMAGFPLCPQCRREYEDPGDRRYHAQPLACPDCGPQLRFSDATGAGHRIGDTALAAAMEVLATGGTLAVKGLGGYHLACDATSGDTVARLRMRKGRGDKPFAVMVGDLAAARELVDLTDGASELLQSPAAPIVVAPVRSTAWARDVAAAVAPGNGLIGVMLAYTPLHHLLFTRHPQSPRIALAALVMTSGNRSEEPICTDPPEAQQRLAGIADAFLHHDRPIHVACDDSVVRSVGGRVLPVRRSRGYAPLPVDLPRPVGPVLAVGGELKTTLCLAMAKRAWLSQHIGDTQQLETLELLARTAGTLAELTRVTPEVVACDAHPGYLSASWARREAARLGVPVRTVQHHHAHLGALLAEWRIPPDEPVLGFVFDGTGYGTDGTIWGGELLLGSYDGVDRVGHVRPIALPGGDAAIRRPARTALAHLHAAGLTFDPGLPPVAAAAVGPELAVIGRMLDTGAGCVPTTSMGRVFDAISSLLGVCQDAPYEGAAAMALEALAVSPASPHGPAEAAWDWELRGAGTGADPLVLDPAGPLRAGVVAALASRAASASWSFHAGLARAVARAAEQVCHERGVTTVGLTGGVFQNVLLTQMVQRELAASGLRVLVHKLVPPNDGGIALGQAVIAAAG